MKSLSSQEIYSGRVLTLRQDRYRMNNGKEIERLVVAHPGAVVIVAADGGDLLFVRQFRYAAGEELLELVAGTCETGEEPLATAARELQEEAGYKAGRLTKLAEFYSAPGFCSELLHLYLATELSPSKLRADDDEEIEVVRLPVAEAIQLAVSGQIRDAKSLAGVLLYAQQQGAQ